MYANILLHHYDTIKGKLHINFVPFLELLYGVWELLLEIVQDWAIDGREFESILHWNCFSGSPSLRFIFWIQV